MIRVSHRAFDALLGVVIALLLVVETLSLDDRQGPLWANLVVVALAPPAVLLIRRRRPLEVVAAICLLFVVAGVLLTPITSFAGTIVSVLVAAYSLGRYDAGRRLWLGGAVLAATVVLVDLTGSATAAGDFVFPAVMLAAAVLGGRALRDRALVTAELADRHERLLHEQDAVAAQATDEERRRIARELHDVVAHTLSVMVVQAGAARRTLDRDAGRAVEALEVVEETGREALGELRRLLGFVARDDAAPLAPQPGLEALGALVARATQAGLHADLHTEGAPAPLPSGAEVAMFRIVQEALTNALKHGGPGTRARVTLRWEPGGVEVEVATHGGAGQEGLPSGGHGLAGMRERAALYGGSLEATPQDGAFVVRARLPVAEAVA